MKNIFKTIGKEFVFGSHMLALDAVAMVYSVFILTNQSINFILLSITYLVVQIIYTYNHIREADSDAKSNPERSELFKKNRKKYTLAGYTTLLGTLLTQTNLSVAGLVIFLVLAGILYTDYFKKLKILGFKNFYVALSWVLITLTIPLKNGEVINQFYLLLLTLYFLTAFSSTIFFDLKDIESDSEAGIKTFPVVLGLPKTLKLLNLIKLTSLGLLVFAIIIGILPKNIIFYALSVLYGAIYINLGSKQKDKKLRLVSYLFADAEFIFWLIILLIAK